MIVGTLTVQFHPVHHIEFRLDSCPLVKSEQQEFWTRKRPTWPQSGWTSHGPTIASIEKCARVLCACEVQADLDRNTFLDYTPAFNTKLTSWWMLCNLFHPEPGVLLQRRWRWPFADECGEPVCATRRIISCSVKVHWSYQTRSDQFGHATRAQNLSAGLFTNFLDGPRSQSLSRKLELHVTGRHGRLRAWYQRFHPQFQQLTECTLRRHWRLHSNIVLFLSFFRMFTGRHGSAVQYEIVFPRTHIWIETGRESGHLNCEFGWNKCSHTVIMYSCMLAEPVLWTWSTVASQWRNFWMPTCRRTRGACTSRQRSMETTQSINTFASASESTWASSVRSLTRWWTSTWQNGIRFPWRLWKPGWTTSEALVKANRRWSETSHHQPESTSFEFGWRHQWMSSRRRRWWVRSSERTKRRNWSKNVPSGAFCGSFIYRLHVMNRETLSVPREESLPVQFNYIDVVRHTQTHLDILHEQKSTNIGKSMVNEHNLDSGLDSRASQCWVNLHLTDVYEQEKDSQPFKLHPGLMKFGRKCGRTCPNNPKVKKDGNGTLTNPSWTLHADWEESITLIRTIRNLTTS